jgi:RimJ/RimL family protein N-acetyltransferase
MGFSEFKAEKLYAYADVNNLASLNVLKKIGFKEKGTFIDDTDGVECMWYEISRE